MKEALNADDPVRDVATAEELLKKHGELGDDIRAHDDESVFAWQCIPCHLHHFIFYLIIILFAL